MRRALIHIASLCLLTGFYSLSANAALPSFSSFRCVIALNYQGPALRSLQEQIATQADNLIHQRIAVIDLNGWSEKTPYIPLSGYQKNLFRKQFAMKYSDNGTLIFRGRAPEKPNYQQGTDLIDIILSCP